MSSGGRRSTSWKKGEQPRSPGRPQGAKDKVPRSFKASIKAVFEDVASTEQVLIRRTVIAGLKARGSTSYMFTRMMAEYLDGKPTEHVKFDGAMDVTVIDVAKHELAVRLARLAERAGTPIVHRLPDAGAGSEPAV